MPASQRKFCVYCKPEDINDATFRYVDVIRQGLRLSGREDLGITHSETVLRQADDVVSISCMPAAKVMLKHPRARLVHWFQGIEAVERRFLHGGFKGWARYAIWSALESLVLRRADLKLFVSDEMRHYLDDSRSTQARSLVIPCYNADFDTAAWADPTRYARLDLVYAGSLYKWQRVEDVLKTFKCLRHQQPHATLTLFTREVERAHAMCRQLGVDSVRVESVTPEQLVAALRRFSYGFILREDIAINRVSTPTKLSTYMAAGVIPVLTEATPALSRVLADTQYKVLVQLPTAHQEIASRLSALAQRAPDTSAVRTSYERIFQEHFSDALHAQRIAAALKLGAS